MGRIDELMNEYRMGDILDDCGGVNRLHGLKDLIDENLNENFVVCEIGSYEGKSSELFAMFCKTIYCVDIFGDNIVEQTFDKLLLNYKNIIKMKYLSSNASKSFNSRFFDFVYIDANHDYESVKQDILLWIDKVRYDGYIGGHDYHYGSGGVFEATQEIFNGVEIKIYSDSSWIVKIKDYRKDNLNDLAVKYSVDKCNLNREGDHNYIPFYEMILSSKRFVTKNILEIGIATGGSLKMWKDYFPNSDIFGWDIIDEKHLDDERIKTAIVDQGNTDQINNFINEVNVKFDFIIDDGSHLITDQIISLFNLFPHLKSGGIYIIEDLWYDEFDCFLKLCYKKDYFNAISQKIKSLISDDKILYLLDNLECFQKNNIIFSSGEKKSDHQFYTLYKK